MVKADMTRSFPQRASTSKPRLSGVKDISFILLRYLLLRYELH